MADYHGPAPFSRVLKEAEKLKEARAISAEKAKQARFQELLAGCLEADDALDGRRRRKEKDAKWREYHDLVAQLTEAQHTDFQIAGALCDRGFLVNRNDVYAYQRRSGLRSKGDRICGGISSDN